MATQPTKHAWVEIQPLADGFTVTATSTGTGIWLNRTAALVLQLCTGANSAEAIAEALAQGFGLTTVPHQHVEQCLDQLLQAGLITYEQPVPTGGLSEISLLLSVHAPSGVISVDTTQLLLAISDEATLAGYTLVTEISTEPSVRNLRNRVANHVLNSPEVTHLLFLSATTQLRRDQLRHALESGHDVVSLAPPNLHLSWDKAAATVAALGTVTAAELEQSARSYPLVFGRGQDRQQSSKRAMVAGFIPALSVGGDGLLISRRALLKLSSAQAAPRHARQWQAATLKDEPLWGFFDPLGNEAGEVADEETSFCARWRSVNGEIWVDVSGALGESIALAQRVKRQQ